MMAGLLGAAGGFLIRNYPPAKIFMGDAGSLFLGFVMAGVSLVSDYAYTRGVVAVLVFPVLLVLVPVLDTAFVTVTRLLTGRSVAQGGRDHISHRLVALGMSERRALGLMLGISAASGLLAIVSYEHGFQLSVIPWRAAYNAGVEQRATDVMGGRLRGLADLYARRLRQHLGDNLVSVVLYGSVARGEARPGSDVDIMVVCEELPDGRFARLARLEGAERGADEELARLRAEGLDTRLAVIVRTRSEAERTIPLYLDMVEDARLLHDHGQFFAGVLERLRARLAALGAERRRRGRARYWILKRDFTPGEVIEL